MQYFHARDPSLKTAMVPALLLSLLLFTRSPYTNYVFDEQEALLANPYVNGHGLGLFECFRRDFWGLLPDRSIGSYRPLPNLIWRVVGSVHQHPFIHHLVNIVVHATNASLVASLAWSATRDRWTGWLAGMVFLVCAVLTEAVSGVVGLADVLAGLFVLVALDGLRRSVVVLPVQIFGAVLLGLLSKESSLVAVGVVPWAALVLSPVFHSGDSRRWSRALSSLGASLGGFVAYTYLRRHYFPVAPPSTLLEPLAGIAPWYEHGVHKFLLWFRQPPLPRDPINNPLVGVEWPQRLAAAWSIYARGLCALVFPWRLSGDYSYAEEVASETLLTPWAIVGAVLMAGSPIAGLVLGVFGLGARVKPDLRAKRALAALVLVWIPATYFPHSNIPILLPTVRAERFWYLPALAHALAFASFLAWLLARLPRRSGYLAIAMFFVMQAVQARRHALDYNDDLQFWRATARASPRSAKAHLNYGIMLGARAGTEEPEKTRLLSQRLQENRRAIEIAPHWAMAQIYHGEVLCRLGRTAEAWNSFERGFVLGPNDRDLVAIGLQNLWDKDQIEKHREHLERLSERYPGSWLSYLVDDLLLHGDEHHGVRRQYRPRAYDEGPRP